MAGSSGGSITLRLAVAGSEEVKAALASIGPAGAKALREIEQAQAAPTAGMRALSAGARDVESAMRGMGGRLGVAGSALSAMGPAGLAAAAGIGALLAAAKIGEMAVKTAQWADGVRRFAELTGVSTKEVQEFDFIAQAAGIPVDKMRDSVKGLGEQIGKLQDNLARGKASPQIRVFEGILGTDDAASTEAKLRSLGGVVPILQQIAAYAEKLSPTERLGLAKALKIDPEVLQSLIEVKGGLAGLTGEMQRYGLIVDDSVIKKSADAAEKMRIASAVIQGELRVAFVQLAPVAVGAAGGLIKVAGAIADVIAGARAAITPIVNMIEALEKIPGGVRAAAQAAGWKPNGDSGVQLPKGTATAGLLMGASAFAGPLPLLIAQLAQIGAASTPHAAGAVPPDPLQDFLNQLKDQVAGTGAVKLPPAAGGRGRAPAAPKDPTDEIAQHVNEMLAQANADVLKAKRDELTAQLASTKDEQQRAAIQAQINQIDDAARDAESVKREQANSIWLDEVKHKKGVSAADLRTATAAVAAANLAEQEARLRQSGVASQRDLNALAAKRADAEKLLADAQKEALQAQIDQLKAAQPLARTMAARRDLALQLFDLEEQQKEAELRERANDSQASPDQRATSQAQLNSLLATAGMRRQATSNANPAGPWDQMLTKMTSDTQTFGEEWQTLAVDGVEKFSSGLFDSEGRIRNMGEVFRSVITDMLTMLEQYLVKQALIGAFGNGQPGTPGAGGLFSQLGSLFGGGTSAPVISAGLPGVSGIDTSVDALLPALPALAGGGDVRGKGTGRSDSVLMWGSAGEKMMNVDAVSRFGPALDAMNAGRPVRIPHFAGGGQIGGGDLASYFAPATHHWHIDNSIHAPGADPAQLNRVAQAQKDLLRTEPQRWGAYAQAAGVIPKQRRR